MTLAEHVTRAASSVLRQDPIMTSLLLPLLAFVLLYSLLPHKELRFLLIMVPAVDACAAGGNEGGERDSGVRAAVDETLTGDEVPAGSVCVCGRDVGEEGGDEGRLMITIAFLVPSVHNYPGGHAMMQMNVGESVEDDVKEMIRRDIDAGLVATPSVHIDVYSAQTGVSRYLEIPGVVYNKTEDLTDFDGFDYLLTHNVTEAGDHFRVIGKERCFVGIDWKKARIRLDTCVYLMKHL